MDVKAVLQRKIYCSILFRLILCRMFLTEDRCLISILREILKWEYLDRIEMCKLLICNQARATVLLLHSYTYLIESAILNSTLHNLRQSHSRWNCHLVGQLSGSTNSNGVVFGANSEHCAVPNRPPRPNPNDDQFSDCRLTNLPFAVKSTGRCKPRSLVHRGHR